VVTFGTIIEDTEREGFLKLTLEGKQLPGLRKKADRLLKNFKPLPYQHVILVVNGQEVDDIADPDDTDTDTDEEGQTQQAQQGQPQTTGDQQQGQQQGQQETLGQVRAIMERILPTLRNLITANAAGSAELAKLAAQFQQQLRNFDAAGAKQTVEELVGKMRAGAGTTTAYGHLVEEWNAARTQAANDIKELKDAIVAEFKDAKELPEIQQGVARLDAIMTTLGPALQEKLSAAQSAAPDQRPAVHKQVLDDVKEYRNFVASNELVAAVQDNPFKPVDLRGYLTPPLEKIEKALAA